MARVTFRKGAKVARIEKRLENPSDALRQIGAIMVAESQRAFKDQRFGATKWEPRGTVNVFGIIADFHAGKKSPPERRFESRPALRDTGKLAASIAFQLVGADAVEVGTNVAYAAVHQKGGRIESKPITEAVQAALWKWLKSKGLPMKRRLGWLLNPKLKDQKLVGTVPARPFIGLTPKTRLFVKRALGVSIMEVK